MKILKNANQSWKFMNMYETYESFHDLLGKGAKSELKGTKGNQRNQNEKQKVPKANQKGAKGSQKWATWRPKGVKSEPRGDQNASKNRVAEMVTKKEKSCEP